MANTIRIKRRASPGSSGAPASLYQAELAWNENDDTLYIGEGDSGGGIASSIIAIAGSGNFLTLGTPAQTVTGSKTFEALTFNPATGSTAPFTVGANGTDVLVDGLNADQVDGIEGASLLRSDASDNYTSGTLTFDSGTTVVFNNVDVDFNTQLPQSSIVPAAPNDFVNKAYADGLMEGLRWKEPVVVATTGSNITLSGTQTIDGVGVIADDRVLVKDQTTVADNGIYVVAAGAWSRSADANAWDELVSAAVFVSEGTANSDKGYTCTSDAGGTLGSTDVTWVQFTSSSSYTAGDGLTESPAFTFNVGGTTDRISVTADAVDIAAGYVGQTSITTLGTIATGTWQATIIGTEYGGTGADLGALANDSLIKKTGGDPGSFVAAVAEPAAGGATGDYLDTDSMVNGGTF